MRYHEFAPKRELDDALQPTYTDYNDARRPRLTLRHLHKARLKMDKDRQEQEEQRRIVATVYRDRPNDKKTQQQQDKDSK